MCLSFSRAADMELTAKIHPGRRPSCSRRGRGSVDRGEATPERCRQDDAADGGLQIEPDQRNFRRDGLGVRDQLLFACALHRGERQQPGVIAKLTRKLRFLDGLRGEADHAGNHHDRTLGPFGHGAHGEIEHRPISRTGDLSMPQEREIEVVERHEEPFTEKRVTGNEEIVVRKEVVERPETVRGTVRETKVEIEDDKGRTTTPTAPPRRPRG